MKSIFALAATLLLALSAQAQSFQIEIGGSDRGGFDRGGGFDRPGFPGRGGDYGPGYPGRGPGGGWGRETTRTVVCESVNHGEASCRVGGRIVEARVGRQLSKASCIGGQTWGYDRDYVWVRGGCRAEFNVVIREEGRPGRPGPGPGYPGPGPGPGPRPPRFESVYCGSQDYRFNNCPVRGFIDYVEVEAQHSRSACVRGQTYGYNNGSIWVDRGCSATFRVFYR